MMVKMFNIEDCCGCGGCANVCKHNAISMKMDKEGFLYPFVEKDKCVECNLCEAVCPLLHDKHQKLPLEVFAVKCRDEKVRALSSSGGFFSVLMNYTIERGGVIYGAAFDTDFNVVHIRAENIKECEKFRGAKYVQSTIGLVYRDVLLDLKNGRQVLFSGTPCQIATLLKMVENKRENLVTCDILCHGVPSPKIWRDYLSTLPEKPSHISFRDKENGWHSSHLCIFSGKTIIVSESHAINDYSQMYFKHLSLRPSCAKCPYASMERCGDFSIGDFWGIEKVDTLFDDNKGVSLVFANTQKALAIFNDIKEQLIVKIKSIEDSKQPILENPSMLHEDRELFWICYTWMGFNKTKTIFLDKYIPNLFVRIEFKIIKKLYKLKRKIGV